jgi:ribulose-phosphate 3-epimerase
MKVKIAPSILSSDFSCLAKEVKKVELAGADMLHIDVMDGHFVPNITIGPAVVKALRRVTKLPLDVHLMIEDPGKFVDDFAKAGSDMITMHIETVSKDDFRKIAQELRVRKIKVGISLNPKTPLEEIKDILNYSDFVLVMSVNPGFSGQEFMPCAVEKIRQLRGIFGGDIAVDGGINEATAKLVLDAGANILMAGSYVFGAKNKKGAIERIRNAR